MKYIHKGIGVPEEKRKDCEKIFWTNNGWKFSNLMKNMKIHIQESQQILRRINSKRSILRYIIFKVSNSETKKKNLESS